MDSAVLGPYRLDAVLARGPAATVYRALDTSHDDRVVALKVFSQALSADPVFRERFRRDAGLLSALREPQVVPIHRYGEIDGVFYVDMRLVHGLSLAETVRAGPLEPARAAAIGQQIAAAGEALRRGGLGDRSLDRGDVLLTGSPGREFVQLVGLGLGRPPAAVPTRVEALVPLPTAGAAPSPPPTPLPPVAPAPRRRRSLGMAAALVTVTAVLAAVVVVGWSGWWPVEQPPDGRSPGLVATMTDTGGGVVSADTREHDGRQVLVTAAPDGTVRTWDVMTGEMRRPPIAGSAIAVALAVLDGRGVIVVRNRDSTVTVYDLATGAPTGPPIGTPVTNPAAHQAAGPAQTRLETAVTRTGTPIVVTARDTGATVAGAAGRQVPQVGLQPFVLLGGGPAGPLVSGRSQSIGDFRVAELDGRPIVISIVGNSSVHAWDLATGERIGTPTPPQPAPIGTLATVVSDGAPVVLTGGFDNLVRVWDLRSGEQVGTPLTGHTGAVERLATVRLGTRTAVLSAASAGGSLVGAERAELRCWDLSTGAPLCQPLTGHPVARGLVAVTDGPTPLVVAAQRDGRITIWDAQVLIEGGTQ